MDRNFASSEEVFFQAVALRKESVDRNARTSWRVTTDIVALRKESVDRNFQRFCQRAGEFGRSPQGERG